MSIARVSVEEFLTLSERCTIWDVRSPGEYAHAHIPGAISLPLFSDDQRAEVGTAYKQVSRENAIKLGLDFFGPKMRTMVETVEERERTEGEKDNKTVLVHCWRGGMRSGAVAWLLDLYGFKVVMLDGGYKAFRNWILNQFTKDYNFKLIGGYTGSGKTKVLHELNSKGLAVIDLEGIAQHKGSAFGGLDKLKQPSTEMFENLLAYQLYSFTKAEKNIELWVEDESQRIGDLNMPIELWNIFRTKPLFFLNIPFEKRLQYLVAEYGKHKKEDLLNAIVRIQKRLGGLETKTAVNCLLEQDLKGCFEVLLRYYDKHYSKALTNRPNIAEVRRNIEADEVDARLNANKILNEKYESANGE